MSDPLARKRALIHILMLLNASDTDDLTPEGQSARAGIAWALGEATMIPTESALRAASRAHLDQAHAAERRGLLADVHFYAAAAAVQHELADRVWPPRSDLPISLD